MRRSLGRDVDITFHGGPYDGLRLTDGEVRRCTLPLTIRTASGVRLFSLLPRPADWDAVLAGDADLGDSRLYPYELVLTPGTGCGAEFVDASENGAFSRALDEGCPE